MLLRHEVESALESLAQFGGYALAALSGALAAYLAWRWRRGMITAPIAERVG
jgi:hypothetical protein